MRLLAVRLGAMGDIVHALPAVAALRKANPGAHLAWLVERKWAPLLEGNPHLDEVIVLERGSTVVTLRSALTLRKHRFDRVYDFQGLLKSAVCARLAGRAVRGFARAQLREGAASVLYSETVNPRSAHVVDLNMELAGLPDAEREFYLPPGKPEGALPAGDFILASPGAGWPGKEWPRPRWEQLRGLLAERGTTLVLNGPPRSGLDHECGLPGLIDATRRARAVVGVDSGPLHIAAALGKAGVAIFGPTDPARNGPYGGTIRVLRSPAAETTYKRTSEPALSMLAISAQDVAEALPL